MEQITLNISLVVTLTKHGDDEWYAEVSSPRLVQDSYESQLMYQTDCQTCLTTHSH